MNAVGSKRTLIDGRMAERLSPSEYRLYLDQLPAMLRDRVLAVAPHKLPMADRNAWDMEWHPWGTVIRPLEGQRKHLCIVFTGYAYRFFVPPVTFVPIFPRRDYDFAFVFDPYRAFSRVDASGREQRPSLFAALSRYAADYGTVLTIGHSAGAVPALEFQRVCTHARAIAVSPARVLVNRVFPLRTHHSLGLAYDWYCACEAPDRESQASRLIAVSKNDETDLAIANRLATLSASTLMKIDGPKGHGLWRKAKTSLRAFHTDLDKMLSAVEL